jgi:Xaa-Pro dipeptidase
MRHDRLETLLHAMAAQQVSQLVLSEPSAIFYLTGLWIHPGERMLALSVSLHSHPRLFVNELFSVPEDVGAETVWFDDTQDGVALLAGQLAPGAPVGVDKAWPARFLLRLMELMPGTQVVNASALLDRLRMRKDPGEQAAMREASRLNDRAFEELAALIPRQYSERQLAQCLPALYEGLGADGCAFEPIVAYGANAAEAHHSPGRGALHPGDCVVIDIGCRKDSYCADLTRTVFYRHAPDRARAVHQVVLEAQRQAIATVRPGARFCEIDAAARRIIDAAGYGRNFTHRTGHSIGLDVHEFGDVSSANADVVEPGMVFSIEPSIKLPGEFGIRVEDLVLVTADGCDVLNQVDTALRIVA